MDFLHIFALCPTLSIHTHTHTGVAKCGSRNTARHLLVTASELVLYNFFLHEGSKICRYNYGGRRQTDRQNLLSAAAAAVLCI